MLGEKRMRAGLGMEGGFRLAEEGKEGVGRTRGRGRDLVGLGVEGGCGLG